MDEEKQNDGMIKKAGDALKKGAKKQAQKSMQKVFKKIIMAIAPYLLKAIAAALIVTIIITTVADLLDKILGTSSKEANAFAVKYSNGSSANGSNNSEGTNSEGEEEQSSSNSIIVDINHTTENGAYILTYEFKDEDGNLYTDDQAITNIKNDLLKENENLDLTKFSPSELKIIGALMYNGLKVERYNEEELKALVVFVKADIASQNLDLSSGNNTDKNIDRDSDNVYGTIQIIKTKIETDSKGNLNYSPEKLNYISYEEFSSLVEQNNEEAIHGFSIDEEGNLVFAKWRTEESNYTYHPYKDIESTLTDEEKQKILQENIKQPKPKETIIVMSAPINFRQKIESYMLNYGLLSDLLIVTDNVQFCLDIAEMAFDSKIVINIKEELQTTDIDVQTDYIQSKLLYDYVKYEVSGQAETETGTWEKITDGTGNPSDDSDLTKTYGWSSSLTPVNVNGNSYGGTSTYEWTHNNIEYKLTHTATISYSGWILYEKEIETTETDLPTEPTEPYEYEEGELIKLNHIKEEYTDGYTIDEDYTDSETFQYTEIEKTYIENNKYDTEISEVDCWYAKYYRGYIDPIQKDPKVIDTQKNIPGQYGEELQLVLETDDEEEINNDSHIKDFKDDKIDDYKDKYTEASDVTCEVTNLTVKQKVKTDKDIKKTTTTISYVFGEEETEADTTNIQFKNVKFTNNGTVFTNEDENEIGFLSIYDKYRKDGVDLYLQNDAEKRLFALLESDPTTFVYSNLIRGLLYVYDGVDRGVTNLENLKNFFEIRNLSSNSSTSLVDYLFDYINYFEGSTTIEGDCYVAMDLGDGCITIGHGITSYVIPGLQEGEIRPIEEIDAIQKDLIRNMIKNVKTWSPELTNYQIVAVVSFLYNTGAGPDLQQSYINYWDQTRDNKYFEGITEADIPFLSQAESLVAQRRVGATTAESEFNEEMLKELKVLIDTELYSNFWGGYCHGYYNGKYITYGGLVWRRYVEFMMFQYGYNAIDGTFYMVNSLSGWEGEVYSNGSYTFPVYNQYDPVWINKMYGNYPDKTIGSSGCGCVAVSTVLSGFTGELITPDILTDKLDSLTNNNAGDRYYSYGNGSTSFVFSSTVTKEYGCNVEGCGNWEDALEAIANGAAVIAYQQNSNGGHIFAIVPADSGDGLFRVIDGAYVDDNQVGNSYSDLQRIKAGWSIGTSAIIYPPEY